MQNKALQCVQRYVTVSTECRAADGEFDDDDDDEELGRMYSRHKQEWTASLHYNLNVMDLLPF